MGRRIQTSKKNNGILVANDKPQYILGTECTYQHKLEEVYPNEDTAHSDLYVANSTGTCIASGDTITMDRSDGTIQTVPSTLQTYLMCASKEVHL